MCVYRAFFQSLSGKFLSPRGIQLGSITNFRRFLREVRVSSVRISWIFLAELIKSHNQELKKIQPSDSRGCSVRAGLTDKHDDANVWDRVWCTYLRHCTTSRKVAGCIPNWSIAILHCLHPSGRTMALYRYEYQGVSWGVKTAGV